MALWREFDKEQSGPGTCCFGWGGVLGCSSDPTALVVALSDEGGGTVRCEGSLIAVA